MKKIDKKKGEEEEIEERREKMMKQEKIDGDVNEEGEII